MNTTTSCNDAGLHSLLKGHESSHEYRSALQHVDSCSACQVRLEQMAADSGLWQEAHELLTTGEGSAAGDAEADEISFPWNRHPIAWSESMAKSLLSPPSHPEMLGRVGRYDVERLIGSGGMGVVFKAWDTELNRPVAVKLLAPYLLRTDRHVSGSPAKLVRQQQSSMITWCRFTTSKRETNPVANRRFW